MRTNATYLIVLCNFAAKVLLFFDMYKIFGIFAENNRSSKAR